MIKVNYETMIEYGGVSDEGMKALQIMQLALQYLQYSQQILVQKIRTTKLYIEKQKEQIQVCQDLKKKQKSKIKSYEKTLESLDEQALNYELLAKKTCPDLFNKNPQLFKELAAGNDQLLRNEISGKTLMQQLQEKERQIANKRFGSIEETKQIRKLQPNTGIYIL